MGRGVGLKSTSPKLGGDSHIRRFTLSPLIRRPHNEEGKDKNKDLGYIGPYLPTAPGAGLRVGGDYQPPPYSGLELGTWNQLKLAPFLPSEGTAEEDGQG